MNVAKKRANLVRRPPVTIAVCARHGLAASAADVLNLNSK